MGSLYEWVLLEFLSLRLVHTEPPVVHQWQFRFSCPSTGFLGCFSPGVSTSIRFDSLYPLVGLSGQWFALGSHFSCRSKKSFCFFSCLERASLESFNQRNNYLWHTLQEILRLPYGEKTANHQVPMNWASAAFKLVELLKKNHFICIYIFTDHTSCFEMQGTSGSYQAASRSKARQDILHWVPGNLGRFLPDWELRYPQVDIQGGGWH